MEGDHALIVEVAPGLAIERVIDLALKAVPEVEPGIHFVERQFGVLEVHAADPVHVERAGEAILAGIGARAEDALRPRVLYTDVIEDVTDRHAVIVNRNREASMLLPGQTLLVVEMTPALFAAVAANAAERVAPDLTLVTVSMIGAAGRVYLAATAALPHYGLSPDATATLCNVSENHTYRVDDPATGRAYALRVHRPGYRTARQIESELEWIDALRSNGAVDTCVPVAATGGERV